MPSTTRATHSRPPAYYLGRPATWWLIALRPPLQRLTRPAAAGLAEGGEPG